MDAVDPITNSARTNTDRTSYVALMALSAICSFGKGFVFAGMLGSEDFSYYAAVDLVVAYGIYAGTWGLLEGLGRQLPLLIGAKRGSAARDLAERSGVIVLVLTGLAYAAYAAVVWSLTSYDERLRAVLLLAGLLVVVNNLFLFAVIWIQACQQSVKYGTLMLAKNGTTLVVGALAAQAFGLWGVLAAEIGTTALIAAWSFAVDVPRPMLALRVEAELRSVFRLGLPMMMGALLANLGRNIDRLAVGAALGLSAFGQYSFAMLLAAGGMVALNIVSQYVTPQICHAVGAGSDLATQKRRLDRLSAGFVVAGAAAYPLFFLGIDWLGAKSFPGFAAGLELMKIVYWGALAQILFIYHAILVAAGSAWRMFQQSAVVVVVSGLMIWAVVEAQAGMLAFGWIFVAHRLLAGALAYAAAHQLARRRPA